MKKHIPNLLTLCNASCGCIGLVATTETACLLIFIALIFDFADGFAARLLNVKSEIGKQLDSLADAITFGVLPAFITYKIWLKSFVEMPNTIVLFLPFILALFSILRLAKFNIDTRQTEQFIGLPTPANAMLWASLPLIQYYQPKASVLGFQIGNLLRNPWFLGILIGLMSLLLVSELPLFALKFKDFSWKNNQVKYIFLLLSVVLIAFVWFWAIPVVLFMYISMSFFQKNNSIH